MTDCVREWSILSQFSIFYRDKSETPIWRTQSVPLKKGTSIPNVRTCKPQILNSSKWSNLTAKYSWQQGLPKWLQALGVTFSALFISRLRCNRDWDYLWVCSHKSLRVISEIFVDGSWCPDWWLQPSLLPRVFQLHRVQPTKDPMLGGTVPLSLFALAGAVSYFVELDDSSLNTLLWKKLMRKCHKQLNWCCRRPVQRPLRKYSRIFDHITVNLQTGKTICQPSLPEFQDSMQSIFSTVIITRLD